MENLFLNHKGNKKIKISNNGLTRHGLEQTNTDTIGNMMRFKQYYVYRSIDRAEWNIWENTVQFEWDHLTRLAKYLNNHHPACQRWRSQSKQTENYNSELESFDNFLVMPCLASPCWSVIYLFDCELFLGVPSQQRALSVKQIHHRPHCPILRAPPPWWHSYQPVWEDVRRWPRVRPA